MSYIDTVPKPEKVDEFSEHAEEVPSEDGDWAGVTNGTRISMQEDYVFEESNVAFVAEDFDHKYQFRTDVTMRDIQAMQEDPNIRLTERKEPDANGIVEEGDNKYTLETQIQTLARRIVNDGRSGTPDSIDDITIEYTEYEPLDRYRILIKW